MSKLASLAILVLVADVTWAQEPHRHELPPPLIELAQKEVCMPLTFAGGRPVIEAKLNGKGPFRFYFDTGASGPVIGQKLAKELELEVIGEARVKSGGDAPDKEPIPADVVRLNQVEMGGVTLKSLHVVAMDRGKLGGEDAPSGVLSPAWFRGYLVSVDYPKKELRIREGGLEKPDGKSIFGYQANKPIPSLMVKVADQEIEAHLDSGSGGAFTLPANYAERVPLHAKATDTKRTAGSVSGRFPVLEGKLKGVLAFGKYSLTDPTIEFSDVVRRGNIGSQILKRFVITLDVENRRFRLDEVIAADNAADT